MHFFFQSSLLMALLGEMPNQMGTVSIQGKIGYTAQQPWVFSGTLRNNILFGQPYERIRYERVIKKCALRKVCSYFIVFRANVLTFNERWWFEARGKGGVQRVSFHIRQDIDRLYCSTAVGVFWYSQKQHLIWPTL